MLRRLNIWLDDKDLKRLAAFTKKMTPGTTVSQLIRQAIREYIERQEARKP
jgi:predicted transcriptional regulator